MPIFEQNDHLTASSAITAGNAIMLYFPGGPVVLMELAPFSPLYLRGKEQDGSITTVGIHSLTGWSIVPLAALDADEAATPAGTPLLADEDGSDAEYLAAWKDAFVILRAACDKSDDPDVMTAMANLEAIEVMSERENPE